MKQLFTGIIEETGKIKSIKRGASSASLYVLADKVLEGTKTGDSICVNGVCLTVTSLDENGFCADVMDETIRRSSLGKLSAGSEVNLERAMPANGRFGGHMVSGHIDGTGIISDITREEMAVVYRIKTDEAMMRYIVTKGSVALDGISLTVAASDDKSFTVSIIPHTGSHTTLSSKKVGDIINIETDIYGKYIEKLNSKKKPSKLDSYESATEFLAENGFI